MKRKFLMCERCGNFIEMIHDAKITPVCCNIEMKEVVAKTSTDEKGEKHVPVIIINKNIATIKVGERLHPMESEHYIKWIYVDTNKRKARYELNPNDDAIVNLELSDHEKVLNAYAYCNLHGLWIKEN